MKILTSPEGRRKVLFYLEGTGRLRVHEKDGQLAVTRPAGSGQKGVYIFDLATANWGRYVRETETADLTETGLYALLRRLDIDLSDISDAISQRTSDE